MKKNFFFRRTFKNSKNFIEFSKILMIKSFKLYDEKSIKEM